MATRTLHPGIRWRLFVFGFLLTGLPVSAGGVAVVGTVISDNGDSDTYADTQETVTLRLIVRNTTGVDLEDLTARLRTTDGAIACLTQPWISIGAVAADEERTTDEGFVFVVPPNAQRAAVEDDLSVRFAVSIESPGSGELATVPWIDLDLDLDVSGGSGPTTYFESFEDGFGSFTTMHLDEPLNPPESDFGNTVAGESNADDWRCQYHEPEFFSQTFGQQQSRCYPTPNFAADTFYFGIVTDRAFTGTQSMGFSVFLDEVLGRTTPTAQVEAIRTIDPVNLAWDGAEPKLSFKHQVSFLDHRSVSSVQPRRTADRGVVMVQLAGDDATPVGAWTKAYPFVNTYDNQANSNYTNCTFDPADDGNTEDDFFDPTDPLRSQGPSSTCAPEFSFAHQGDTDDPYDPANVGDGEVETGLLGETGMGTWVEPIVDLGRFRGRRIRVRFLQTGLKVGADDTWESAFRYNPDPGDDGWFIDDVTITDALEAPATVTVDAADNSGLPFDLGDDAESDGVFDVCDNCPGAVNTGQGDRDGDGLGDICDVYPDDPDNDIDADGVPGLDDNCPTAANADQVDSDGDGHGDVCDNCPLDFNRTQDLDEDEDGVPCPGDNCERTANTDQADEDRDGLGDACDGCPGDPLNDPDGDQICGLEDSCPFVNNPSQGLGFDLASLKYVKDFQLSPDETVVVARRGHPTQGLFSVPALGGKASTLSHQSRPSRPGIPVDQYAITADSSTVVYRWGGGLNTIPAAGGYAIRLGLDVSAGRVVDFALSPEGMWVVYGIEVGDPASVGVYVVSSFGGPSTRLSPPPIPGLDATGIRISHDGSRVLFIQGDNELYSAPIDGGPPVQLTLPLSAGRQIFSAEISPDGSRVVYVADRDQFGVRELYSVPSDAFVDPPAKINGTMVSGGDVTSVGGNPHFKISPGGSQVVYTADQETDHEFELFQVSIEGGPVRKLNDPLITTGDVLGYEFSPDGSAVAFSAETQSASRSELFAIPTDEGAPLLLANPNGQINAFSFTPDGARIVYRRGSSSGSDHALFAVPADGGASVPLSDDPVQFVDEGFAISGDGSRILYRTGSPSGLISVSIDGGPRVDLSGGNNVNSSSPLALTHDGSVAYWIRSFDYLYASWLDHDPDADGTHAVCDCDGDEAAIYPGAPEINDGLDNQCPGEDGFGLVDEIGLTGFNGPYFFFWEPQDLALLYEIVRSADPGFTSACRCIFAGPEPWPLPLVPPPGVTYYYLVRAAMPNLGSAGRDSSGNERFGPCLAPGCGNPAE